MVTMSQFDWLRVPDTFPAPSTAIPAEQAGRATGRCREIVDETGTIDMSDAAVASNCMGDSESPQRRESGVDFGALEEELESHDYPSTGEELVDQYGTETLGLPNGETTFGDVLQGYRSNDQFESAYEVRQAVFTMVGTDAVGREQYSDRGVGNAPDVDNQSI